MPFRSKAQRRYLFANKPELARRWQRVYGDPITLPERANGLQGQLRRRRRSSK